MFATAIAALSITMTQAKDTRLDWFHHDKFGMFIHWGLYSVLEGQYGDRTNHAEWIRTTAQIPLEEYDQLVHKFNPTKFNADAWAKMAKDAGMQYVVITTKHHDGFDLFKSKVSDFDIDATPFKRDIMAELSQAVRANGLKMGWYHSIMDWHHPDYLPRRDWEKNRSAAGADFDRYNKYLEDQVSELLTNYGPISVMWFDGEWESTWNHTRGQKLYDLCRKLQPNVIVNNRVDVGRGGMAGFSDAGYAGDYGTPEQEIPAQGIPGVSWESCITMNGNWGWNKADKNWKSTTYLVDMLVDIVSKGGNLLLNIGPKPDGTFPQEAIDRLKGIGDWMKINSDAIYGTTASPFKNLVGAKATAKGNKVYVILTDPKMANAVHLPGLSNKVKSARFLGSKSKGVIKQELADTTVSGFDPKATLPVLELTLDGPPVVLDTPEFKTDTAMFYNTPFEVELDQKPGFQLKVTTDGTDPTNKSIAYTKPIQLSDTTTIKAAYFQNEKRVTGIATRKFKKAELQHSMKLPTSKVGLKVSDYLGNWQKLPDFSKLEAGFSTTANTIGVQHVLQDEHVGRVYEGFVMAPADGLYTFRLTSDDGSKLYVAGSELIDNDGLHGAEAKTGQIALEAGLHKLRIEWFNATGGKELKLEWKTEGTQFTELPENAFAHL